MKIDIPNKEEKIENDIKSVDSHFKKVGLIKRTNFNSTQLPSGWINNGNFILSNDGAQTPQNTGITCDLHYEQYCNFDSDTVSFSIKMTSASDIIINRHHKKLTHLGGHTVRFDFINKKVILYELTMPSVMPTNIIKEFNMTFDPVLNVIYTLTVWRWAEIERFIISGGSHNETFEYIMTGSTVNGGRGYDKYGIVALDGSFIVKSADFGCNMAEEPDVLIYGDSITNGDVLRYEPNGGYMARWAGLLSTKTLVSIISLGGNRATDIYRDFDFYKTLFKPRKVIFALGENDVNFQDWRTGAETVCAYYDNIGVEVIFTTIPSTRTGYEEVHADISEYIVNSGRRYIDFRACLTVNGDGETIINSLYQMVNRSNDSIHPNVEGNRVMFEEVINCIPDIVNN